MKIIYLRRANYLKLIRSSKENFRTNIYVEAPSTVFDTLADFIGLNSKKATAGLFTINLQRLIKTVLCSTEDPKIRNEREHKHNVSTCTLLPVRIFQVTNWVTSANCKLHIRAEFYISAHESFNSGPILNLVIKWSGKFECS